MNNGISLRSAALGTALSGAVARCRHLEQRAVDVGQVGCEHGVAQGVALWFVEGCDAANGWSHSNVALAGRIWKPVPGAVDDRDQ